MFSDITTFLETVFRICLPIVLTAIGGLFSERSGIINIALEGHILFGAFAAAAVTVATQNPYLGVLAGTIAGASLGYFYAVLTVTLKSKQIVAGTGINLLMLGLTPLLLKLLYGQTGGTPAVDLNHMPSWFPYVVTVILLGFAIYVYHWTPLGLRLRFSGEKPEALVAAGISVKNLRIFFVTLTGIYAGLGGAFLSTFLASGFSRNMSAGRGFMALAALILGKWKPVPTILAALFFASFDALQIRLAQTQVFQDLPSQFIQILPYFITLIVLAGFIGKSQAPKALGQST